MLPVQHYLDGARRWGWLLSSQTELPSRWDRMDNADLENLRVSPGKLSPKFKASLTSYSVTVASSVPELKLAVLTSDSGASYSIKVGGRYVGK